MPPSTIAILKSLADETRLSIVQKLVQEGCEVASSDIVSSCASFHQLSQPTMSHHFSLLVRSGVITERKSGTEKIYTLNHSLLTHVGIDPTRL